MRLPLRTLACLVMAVLPYAPVCAEPPLAKDLTDNVRVRLTGVTISERRGRNLMARFVTMEPAKESELVVTFPAHSFTTHEATLINLIRSCVTWSEEGKEPEKWQEVKLIAIFSIPKDANGYLTDFERWYLVSLQMPPPTK